MYMKNRDMYNKPKLQDLHTSMQLYNKQPVPMNGVCVRVDVTKEKDTKVVLWKCYSEGK